MSLLLPELNREFAGLSDPLALQAEIEGAQDRLTFATQQLTLERELANDVRRARSIAITNSSALRLVFNADNPAPVRSKPSAEDMVSSAFGQQTPGDTLPEGFVRTVAKDLWTAAHPDTNSYTEASQKVTDSLANIKSDPTLSIAKAMLSAKHTARSMDAQRLEKYRLQVALNNTKPRFSTSEEAWDAAEVEIAGAEWRVRADAALMSLDLITGGDEAWHGFLQSIVRTNHVSLINMVNRIQPVMFSLHERLLKGDPLEACVLDIEAIDGIFENIWSTLPSKNAPSDYKPPYQNWLEVLLPAMHLLDPGEKPGEKYTYFRPPIEFRRAASNYIQEEENYYSKGNDRFKGLKEYNTERF